MTKSLTVLHLITELSTGGAQSALLRLLIHQDRTRYEPIVACFYNADGAVARQISEQGIQVVDLGLAAQWRVDGFGRLWRLLRQVKPDCLHTWMFHANIPGRLIGRMAGVPAIVSSERTMGQEGTVRQLLNRWSGPLADRIICVSEQVAIFAAETIRLDKHKLRVVPNGIDLSLYYSSAQDRPESGTRVDKRSLRAELGLPESAVIIGAVGRPRPVKGYTYLLDAFAKLVDGYATTDSSVDMHLLFVGDGPDQAVLMTQAQVLGLQQYVSFWGDRDDIPNVLNAMDILVSSSIWEGMPNVVLEAMACGLPVVATDVGGTRELVLHGETGLLVEARDVDSMAASFKRLVDSEDERVRMGECGRRRTEEHFSIQQSVQRTEAVYAELLGTIL